MRQTGRAELDEEEEDLGHWLKSILNSSWNGYVTVSGDTTISLGPVKTRQGASGSGMRQLQRLHGLISCARKKQVVRPQGIGDPITREEKRQRHGHPGQEELNMSWEGLAWRRFAGPERISLRNLNVATLVCYHRT